MSKRVSQWGISRRKFLTIICGAGVLAIVGSISYFFIFSPSKRLPEIRYGVDACDWCHMVIMDKRFACAYWSIDEKKWRKFDDIGCMMRDLFKMGIESAEDIYVSDYDAGVLIDGKIAYYVVADPKRLWTPMSSGIVAFNSKSKAVDLAQQYQGSIMNFNELLNMFKVMTTTMSM